ncbi:uncharacterized protein [Littorina saxatilis]|uniref:uncharacterized protein n=1 Tax=Littorina saxatilis TaxID=31220 RepID=UPI0038B55A4F
MAYHCPMIDCGNGSYRLEKWKAKLCQIHQVSHESVDCSCQPPFSLHPLPTRKKKPSQRDKWIRLISREDTTADGRHKLFSPAKDARVCSRHFLDGNPTAENPFPTENLGYPGFQHKAARVLRDIPQPDHELGRRKRARRDLESQFEACQAQGSSREMDGAASGLPEECDSGPEQDPFATEKCLGAHVFAFYLLMVFFINRCRHMYRRYAHSLVAIVKLTKENNRLKRQVCVLKLQIANMAKKKNADRKKPRLFRNLISHKNVSYYTGMATTSLFRRIHGLVSPFVTRRWQGKVNHSKKARTFINQPMCFGPKRFF